MKRSWLYSGGGILIAAALGFRLWSAAHRPPAVQHDHGGASIAQELDAELKQSKDRLGVLTRYARDDNPKVRLVAMAFLDSFPEAYALAEEGLRDNIDEVRSQALAALVGIDREKARPLVLAALNDPDENLREEACRILTGRSQGALLPPQQIIPYLLPHLDDPDIIVRRFLRFYLTKHAKGPGMARPDAPDVEKTKVDAKWKAWEAKAQGRWPQPAVTVALPAPTRTEPAPDQTITLLDGTRLNPARDGKWTLINFWGTWCEPCRDELPDLERLHKEWGPRGLRVIGVAVSEKKGADGVKQFCQKKGVSYPQALGGADEMDAYGVLDVPITVLIDDTGKLRYRWEGTRRYESFVGLIALFQGHP